MLKHYWEFYFAIAKMLSSKNSILRGFIIFVVALCCQVQSSPISKRQATDGPPPGWRDLIGDDVYEYLLNKPPDHSESVFEGDIKGVDRTSGSKDKNGLAVLAQNAVTDRSQLWKDGVVPYTIGSGYSQGQKDIITGALRDMMSKTCVQFVQRTSERDYITFVNRNAGCSSYVARTGGQQQIDLSEGCIQFGIVQHEVMHALGFFHEQSRKDRDQFVTIVWRNIQRDNYDQFEMYQGNLFGLPYDYNSIMHYGWNYFALDRKTPTIVPKKKGSIGNRKVMSPTDVQKINILYPCTGSKAPAPSSGSSSSSGASKPSSSSGSGSSGSWFSFSSLLGSLRGGSSSSGSPDQTAPVTQKPVTTTTTEKSSGGIFGFIKGLFG